MEKPKLEHYIGEKELLMSDGKRLKVAMIDFASYAFALEDYIKELEKERNVWKKQEKEKG